MPSWEWSEQSETCTGLSKGINRGFGGCVWWGEGLRASLHMGFLPSMHTAPSSLPSVLHHTFPSRARWFCPHFEGGEAVNPEILSDSLRGTSQELSCDLGFLTLCPVRVPMFFYEGCFRHVQAPSNRTGLPPSPSRSIFKKFM